jgi:hypothetical protein
LVPINDSDGKKKSDPNTHPMSATESTTKLGLGQAGVKRLWGLQEDYFEISQSRQADHFD